MANNGINMLIENSLTNGDVVSLSPLGGYYAFRLMNIVGDDVRSIDLTDKPGVQLLSDDATVVIDETPHVDINKRDGQCMFAITSQEASDLLEIQNFSIVYNVAGIYVTLFRGVFVDINKKENEEASSLEDALQRAASTEALAADYLSQLNALQADYDALNTSTGNTISELQAKITELENELLSLKNSMISANIVDEL